VCCLVASAAIIGPRVALVLVWIFGDRVELAFSTWAWPLLGLLLLPWTTLAYVLAWQPGGLDGNWDAALVLLGLALDVVTYISRAAGQKTGVWR
jgi:hypothetical protein